jgi:hypothetical protein
MPNDPPKNTLDYFSPVSPPPNCDLYLMPITCAGPVIFVLSLIVGSIAAATGDLPRVAAGVIVAIALLAPVLGFASAIIGFRRQSKWCIAYKIGIAINAAAIVIFFYFVIKTLLQ